MTTTGNETTHEGACKITMERHVLGSKIVFFHRNDVTITEMTSQSWLTVIVGTPCIRWKVSRRLAWVTWVQFRWRAWSSVVVEVAHIGRRCGVVWDITMAIADPPQGEDESFGPYWDVSKCGDNGGPPVNKVRAM